MTAPRVFGIIVTFRRPEDVRRTLAAIQHQTLAPDVLIVVDNEPSESLEHDVIASGAVYVPMPTNGGPAGGIAAGMLRVLNDASDRDVVVLVDDDNPPEDGDLLERLLHHLMSQDELVAGVGAMGARYNRRIGRLERVSDAELVGGAVEVDYLGGNQLPIYRVPAVRSVGTFDAALFFGYEELDFGLRLRSQGFRLVVPGEVALELRQRYGRLGVPASANRLRARASWRVYYGARNLIHIARGHGTFSALVFNLAHHGVLRPIKLLANGRAGEAALSIRGTFDGAVERMGRRVEP